MGMLVDGCDMGKNFIYISYVEVVVKSKIFCLLVIFFEKWMNIRYFGFFGS